MIHHPWPTPSKKAIRKEGSEGGGLPVPPFPASAASHILTSCTFMHLPPIALISRSKSQLTYDEAGSEVVKGTLLPPSQPSYSPASLPPVLQPLLPPPDHSTVPPLAYYALTRHIKHLETLERSAFLNYVFQPLPYPQERTHGSDLLQLLIPHMHLESRAVRLRFVDPRMWLTIIRSFWPETLPGTLASYHMPLADGYLPYLQYLEPTEHFTLFVILELHGVKELNDETIIQLKLLHQLAVLDCSKTGVSKVGVKKLADALALNDEELTPRGTWRLRFLSLRGCDIDDSVAITLRLFPLLSVIGTLSMGPSSRLRLNTTRPFCRFTKYKMYGTADHPWME